jgi:hypothetical protein
MSFLDNPILFAENRNCLGQFSIFPAMLPGADTCLPEYLVVGFTRILTLTICAPLFSLTARATRPLLVLVLVFGEPVFVHERVEVTLCEFVLPYQLIVDTRRGS